MISAQPPDPANPPPRIGEELNNNLYKKLAKAIFISGSPLRLVEHPLWIDFFKHLNV